MVFLAVVFFAGDFFGERLAVDFVAFAAGFFVVAISLAPQVMTPELLDKTSLGRQGLGSH